MGTRGIFTTMLSCCVLAPGTVCPTAADATSPLPTELSPPGQGGQAPHVAFGANGPALVTWTETIQSGLPENPD